MVTVKATQIVSAEVLVGKAVELITDAANICKAAGEGDAQQQLYRAAVKVSALIDILRRRRAAAEVDEASPQTGAC